MTYLRYNYQYLVNWLIGARSRRAGPAAAGSRGQSVHNGHIFFSSFINSWLPLRNLIDTDEIVPMFKKKHSSKTPPASILLERCASKPKKDCPAERAWICFVPLCILQYETMGHTVNCRVKKKLKKDAVLFDWEAAGSSASHAEFKPDTSTVLCVSIMKHLF